MSRPPAPAPVVPSPALAAPALSPNDPLAALLALQAQTARLHQQFLEGQTQAIQALSALTTGQAVPMPAASPSVPAVPAPAVPIAVAPIASPAPVAPPAAPAVTPPIAAAPTAGGVTEAVLSVVANKTGYPVEMLEPAMGLDADLGIDSIKRVEILSALQEQRPDLPVIGPEQLGSLQTLADVIDHLGGETAVAAPNAPASGVTQAVLSVVASKTGYPVEMLEPSMGLDADLGIDSIKRVEILSALQEQRPDLPVIGPEQLGSLQTLADVIDHLGGGLSPMPAAPPASAESVLSLLLDVVANKTGYPVEMLEPSMGLDADLGIDSIKRVEILSALQEQRPDLPAIGPEQLGALQTLADVVAALGGTSTSTPPSQTPTAVPLDTPSPAVPAGLDRYAVVAGAPVPQGPRRNLRDGVVFVTGGQGDAVVSALTRAGREAQALPWGETLPAGAAGLVVVAPHGADHDFAKQTFSRVRDARAKLQGQGEAAALLLFVTSMGGTFGLKGTAQPVHGALAGLAKTAAREWQDCCVHVIDVAQFGDVEAALPMLGAPCVELAVQGGTVSTVGLQRLPDQQGTPDPLVHPGDVVVVSGGARGVTAAVARALAEQAKCTLVLLGRSPAPDPVAPHLRGATSEAEVRAAVLGGPNPPADPAALREAVRAALAAAEIRATLAAITAAGSVAEYRSCDVRDPAAVQATVANVQATLGPVRLLVHGAGVLADKVITDKTDADLERVYDTKVLAAQNLLGAVDAATLRGLVMFSSSTARFGRVGQADYAMANEVLNKLAQRFAAEHPQARVRAIGWGPWDGGMVTPALAKMFAAEGVRTIGLEAGAGTLVDLLGQPGPAEVVVLGEGSALPGAVLVQPERAPAASGRGETVFSRTVGLDDHPFLASHAIGGKAVLPAAMMLEWFAHAATAQHPGLRFVGLEELEVYRGVKLGLADKLALRIEASPVEKDCAGFRVPMTLCSGGGNGHAVVHARTTVMLAPDAPSTDASDPARVELPAYGERVEDVYATQLFHGSALQGITSIDGLAAPGINATVRSAPRPKEWMHSPARGRWITEPLAIDCGLQAVIVWSATQAGSPSLPNKLGTYRQFRPFPAEGSKLGVRIAEQSGARVVAELDWYDETGAVLARLTGAEFTLDPGLAQAFTRNRVE